MTILVPRNDLLMLQDHANRNWETALQSYRRALDQYRRVLRMKFRRQSPLDGQATARPALASRPDAASAVRIERPAFNSLTPREHEVLQLMTFGYTNQQIAGRLVLSRGTVANHVSHILAKLALDNRTQVASLALRSNHDGMENGQIDGHIAMWHPRRQAAM